MENNRKFCTLSPFADIDGEPIRESDRVIYHEKTYHVFEKNELWTILPAGNNNEEEGYDLSKVHLEVKIDRS